MRFPLRPHPKPDPIEQALAALGGESLGGSGFEAEAPAEDFEEDTVTVQS